MASSVVVHSLRNAILMLADIFHPNEFGSLATEEQSSVRNSALSLLCTLAHVSGHADLAGAVADWERDPLVHRITLQLYRHCMSTGLAPPQQTITDENRFDRPILQVIAVTHRLSLLNDFAGHYQMAFRTYGLVLAIVKLTIGLADTMDVTTVTELTRLSQSVSQHFVRQNHPSAVAFRRSILQLKTWINSWLPFATAANRRELFNYRNIAATSAASIITAANSGYWFTAADAVFDSVALPVEQVAASPPLRRLLYVENP